MSFEKIDLDTLEDHPRNREHRSMSDEERSSLKASIIEGTRHHKDWKFEDGYRLDTTITVNECASDGKLGRILGGHRRCEVLRELGQDWIHPHDVTWVNYTPDSAEELAEVVKLNSPSVQGQFTLGAINVLNELADELPDLAKQLRFGSLKLDLAEQFKTDSTESDSTDEEPTGRLDENKQITCPACGHDFES